MDLKLALLVALIFLLENQETSAKRNYLITAPRTYRAGVTEKLRVQLFNTDDKWNITVRLEMKKNRKEIARATGTFNRKSTALLSLKVEDNLNVVGGRKNGKLFISGMTEDGKFKFSDSRDVTIENRGPTVFIQTDKPIYKPGQKVRMRIVGIDSNLKPLTGKVKRVTVSTSTNIRLMQWDNQEFIDGILSLEMQLSKQPVLGLWKIEAKVMGIKVVQEIKIDKYVLPKFQVAINPPSFVARDSEEITGSICATYTYGQPVKGTLTASFKIVRPKVWWRAKNEHKLMELNKPIKGCTDFKLVGKDYSTLLNRFSSYYGAEFHVEANVTEEATGITRNATTAKVGIVAYRVKLQFTDDTPRYIKPGLPFQGRLKVTTADGLPLEGEMVTIVAKSNNKVVYRESVLLTNGIVDLNIEVPSNAKDLTIDARHGTGRVFGSRYGQYSWYASARLYLRPWFSPSNSFLSIARQTKLFTVGKKEFISYKFTTNENSSTVTVYHSLMCKGEMVATGSQKVKIRRSTKAKLNQPAAPPHNSNIPVGPPHNSNIPVGPPHNSNIPVGPPSPPHSHSSAKPPVPSPSQLKGSVTPPSNTRVPPPLPPREKKPDLHVVLEERFKLQITQEMVPSCRLLVYYIRSDGETVADSVKIDVEDKLENQVFVRFDDDVKKPGQETRLYLQAAPGSRVAIAAVDKSVHLLRAATELTEDKIISTLKKLDVGPTFNYRTTQCQRPWYPRWGPFGKRRRRSYRPYYSRDDDSSKAFNDAGMIYFTNLVIESAKCPRFYRYPMRLSGPYNFFAGRPGPVGMRRQGVASVFPERKVVNNKKAKKPKRAEIRVRKDFPETWLWTEETVDQRTGKKIINATVPDTITSWYANAFAMSSQRGIGVAPSTSLKVFQPFFVSLTLPYSVIRGEELTVITTVFNYMSSCMTIQVDLEGTNDFSLTSSSSHKICVCGNEAKSVNFTIVAQSLGRIPLTVSARDVQQSVCQNVSTEASIGVIDVVKRKLLVEPEGVRKEYTFSKLMCPDESDDNMVSETIKLSLPNRIVPGSVYATLSAIGDLMGPALEGIDSLLRLPVGCGEQNMVLFAPNIYVMQYLNSTRQLTAEIKKKATKFLQIGYQRELTYKHKDGSYSAFGSRDDKGSLWLTAFVLRSFAQARPFIYVDPKEIQHTIEWLKGKQNKTNGCFPNYGKLFHKDMKGGISTPVTLTAFTVLALIEAGVGPKDQTIELAMEKCIVPKLSVVNDSYSLSLLAYTFAIAKHPKKNEIMRKLRRKAIVDKKGGMRHWERENFDKPKHKKGIWLSPYHQAPSADVEMTSYALMAFISPRLKSFTVQNKDIVRWLSAQRNSLGGFHSTQDTCVGLQALAQYAYLAYGDPVRLRIDVEGRPTFRISDIDRLVLKRSELPSSAVPSHLMVSVTGEGCAVVQADVMYNVPSVSEDPAFNVSVAISKRDQVSTLRTATGAKLCAPLQMRICARWLLKGESNMAIVKVKLVSGFKAEEESLDELTNIPSIAMMKYETEGQDVILYFNQIQDVCFSFYLFQDMLVKQTKPASVTVYDYYEPELSATTMYSISEEIC